MHLMRSRPLFSYGVALLFFAAVVTRAGDARADVVDDCIAAAESGERLAREGKLTEARTRLLACRRPVCPEVLRADCEQRAQHVEEASASVVFGPTDDRNADVVGVTIEVDGTPIELRPGRAFELDPGNHTVTARAPGYESTSIVLTVREGEKRRLVQLRLRRHEATTQAGSAAGPPLGSWILFGGSAAALATSGVFAVLTKVEYDRLDQDCSGRCSPAQTADGRSFAVVSTVALALGVAAAAAGAIVWLTHGVSPPRAGAREGIVRPLRF